MSEVIPVRIPKDVLAQVELLVKMGKYANRSEALRSMILERLEETKDLFAYDQLVLQDEKALQVAKSLGENEFMRLCSAIFKGAKPSVELIEEQRREHSLS